MPLTPEEKRRRLEDRKRLASTTLALRRATREAENLGITPTKPDAKTPLFLEILDTLNRPQQALFRTIEALQEGKQTDAVLKEAWGGLSGELERISFTDILRGAGMQDGPRLVSAGFTGNLLLDPLNLVPFGAASKFSKAARIRMLATPEGRRAMTYVSEALRDAPVLGPVRNRLERWFSTKAQVDPREVAPFVRSVEARLAELEGKEFIGIAEPETLRITMRGKGGIADQTVQLGDPIVLEDKAINEVFELKDQIAQVRLMSRAHESGRMPHEIMADYLTAARKSQVAARNAIATQVIPAIGVYFRRFVNPLSEKDQRLVMMASEEMSIVDRAVRRDKLTPVLAQADDSKAVLRSAANHRRMVNWLEDLEEKAGIKVARLGGSLAKRREGIYRAAHSALTDLNFQKYSEIAMEIRNTAFGSRLAQKQGIALANLLDEVATGRAEKQDILGLMEEMTELRGSFADVDRSRLAKLRFAGREALKLAKRHPGRAAPEVSAKSAYMTLVDGIVEPAINKGKKRILALRERKLKELQEALDRVPGYVLHYLDEDAVQHLAKDVLGNSKRAAALGSASHRSMLERLWVDKQGVPLSLQDVNKVLDTESAQLAEVGRSMLRRKRTWLDIFRGDEGKVADYFGLDPAKSLAIRAQRTAQAVSGEQFRTEVSRMFGSYHGADAVTIPGFRGRFVPEMAQHVAHMNEAYFGQDASRSFLKYFDGLQQVWKGFTLFPFPAYHTRNALGDWWLMSIGGFFTRDTSSAPGVLEPFWRAIPDHEAYLDLVRAYRIQTHLATGNVDALRSIKLTLPSGETWDGLELFDMVRRKGGVGIGFHADNIKTAAETEVKLTNAPFENGRFNPRSIPEAMGSLVDLRTWVMPSKMPRNALIRGGRAMAQGISDSHRLAFVMKRMRMGDTLDGAVEHVNKWLLDYTDLTAFETQVMRRVFPFYTWLRKNFPRQLEGLVNSPQKYARIDHIVRFLREPGSPAQPYLSVLGEGEGEGLREQDLPEPVDLPKWMRNAVPFPLRRNSDGDLEVITVAAWHPAAELQRAAPETLGKTYLDMMSPLLKLPLETAMGRNLFFDQELSGTSEFLGREMPATWANALQNVRLLAEFDRLNWFSAMGFSTRRLRPETDETIRQKVLRLFTGARIYPVDTRAAKYKQLQEALRKTQLTVRKEREARRREARRNSE